MWNFNNADIRAVIQMVSKLTGKNFVIDPRGGRQVTLLSDRPMTIDECYQSFFDDASGA